jgi:hypothetical protein
MQRTSVSGLPQTFCPQLGQVNLVLLFTPPFWPGRGADCRFSFHPVAASLAKTVRVRRNSLFTQPCQNDRRLGPAGGKPHARPVVA